MISLVWYLKWNLEIYWLSNLDECIRLYLTRTHILILTVDEDLHILQRWGDYAYESGGDHLKHVQTDSYFATFCSKWVIKANVSQLFPVFFCFATMWWNIVNWWHNSLMTGLKLVKLAKENLFEVIFHFQIACVFGRSL